MLIKYKSVTDGILDEIVFSPEDKVIFGRGPSFYIKNDGVQYPVALKKTKNGYVGTNGFVAFSLNYGEEDNRFFIDVSIKNEKNEIYAPEAIGVKLGIDSYMIEYPQWNDRLFPNFLRCETTHFFGCFISPTQRRLAVVSQEPIAAWEIDYNKISGENEDSGYFGHRILNTNLLLTCKGPLPERYPQNLKELKPYQTINRRIWFYSLPDNADFLTEVSKRFYLPVITVDKFTVAKGETFKVKAYSETDYTLQIKTPDGKLVCNSEIVADNYGYYDITVVDSNGKTATAKVYCRRDYKWYLEQARINAAVKPQRATVCCESWYGFYTAFLAKKHYPNKVLDDALQKSFEEVTSYLFDFETGEVKIMPQRIQNTATAVGVLVDAYESNPKENIKYLDYANLMAENLIKRQTADGAFRKLNEHYTCVIYIAKSILELALCEKSLSDEPLFKERYERHYAAVKRAVDDLCLLQERIGTEGEHTLEDGMISCAALQIGFFALTLPESQRAPYIRACEHMLSVHRCLEQNYVPDTRMRGATLRFWEAQFDILIRGNMLSSPHGWSSWKNYATYYLYLLTGKEEYLRETIDSVGACLQTIDENGNLCWAFVVDPYLNLKVFIPDESNVCKDGYKNLYGVEGSSYDGKFERKVFGETYLNMISDWYRIGENATVTGGYRNCALIYEDRVEPVDDQGGCCDNDVHEHFKCLEETLLKKAFVIIKSDGVSAYNCTIRSQDDCYEVSFNEDCELLHINAEKSGTIIFKGKSYSFDAGRFFIDLNYFN